MVPSPREGNPIDPGLRGEDSEWDTTTTPNMTLRFNKEERLGRTKGKGYSSKVKGYQRFCFVLFILFCCYLFPLRGTEGKIDIEGGGTDWLRELRHQIWVMGTEKRRN